MDDRRRLVGEPLAEVEGGPPVAATTKRIEAIDAVGPLGSGLARRPGRASESLGAFDRRCHEPELGPFRATRWNARKHGCAVGIRGEVWTDGGHLHGPRF